MACSGISENGRIQVSKLCFHRMASICLKDPVVLIFPEGYESRLSDAF